MTVAARPDTGSHASGPDEESLQNRLSQQIEACRETALIYAAIKLGLPDLLANADLSPEDIAEALGGDLDSLIRFVNALAVLGLVEIGEKSLVRLTAAGKLLCRDSESPCRELTQMLVEQHWSSWTHLDHSVLTGQPAFTQLHGMRPFDWRRNNPHANQLFNSWLKKETANYTVSILSAIDLSDCTKVADIAGGNGSLLMAMLNNNKHLQGVLFDQPHVIAQAQKDLAYAPCIDRLEFVSGDFFKGFVIEAGLYVLKSIIHDWNDAESVKILAACRSTMKLDARLILVERLLGQNDANHKTTTMLDMAMMAVTGGRERSLEEYESLLARSGFGLRSLNHCSSGFHVIEALPV